MAKQSIVSVSTQDDLCNWEFVNQFDIESDEDGSNYDVQSVDSILSLSSSSDNDDDDEKEDSANEVSIANDGVSEVVVAKCVRVSDLGKNYVDNHSHKDVDVGVDSLSLRLDKHNYDIRLRQFVHEDDEDDDDDDDDDDEDDEYDVDDELVPWEVKDRFVRQRIRKSGKISCGRTARSKKSALVFTRPGCVRGKHSLGLKVY